MYNVLLYDVYYREMGTKNKSFFSPTEFTCEKNI